MRRRAMRDGGAGMIEYAGLIVLAALVLAALVSILPGSVSDGVSRAVCQIFQGQNCGKAPSSGKSTGRPPSAQSPTRTSYTVPRRFANGFFGGLGNTFGFSRASLPIAPPGPNSGGYKGGDQSSDHNIVLRNTKVLIQQKMGQYVTDGKVTIDCEPGGSKANCIPGAARDGSGNDGTADIILTGKDKDTGKPVIYVWEVKPSKYAAGARIQLDRYIEKKEEQTGADVRPGFRLVTQDPIVSKEGERIRAFSVGNGDDDTNEFRGLRLYVYDEWDKKHPKPQPQEQPQEQPQQQPQQQPGGSPAVDCNGRPIVASLGCTYPYGPGLTPPGKEPRVQVPRPSWRFPFRLPFLTPRFAW